MENRNTSKEPIDTVLLLLAGSLLAMLVIISSMIYQTLEGMQKISSRYSEIIEISSEKVQLTSNMNYAVRNRAQSLLTAFGMDDVFERDEELQKFSRYSVDFINARDRFIQLGIQNEEEKLYDAVLEATRTAQPILKKTADSLLEENLSIDEMRSYFEEGSIMQNKALEALNNLVEWEYQHAAKQQASTKQYADSIENQLIHQGILVFLVGALLVMLTLNFASKKNKQIRQSHKETLNALDNLNETKEQLIQSEKMASLGQMVAGIAHEINNPSNFISGARKNLAIDIENFNELLMDMMDEEEKESKAGQMIRSTFDGFNKQLSLMDDGLSRIHSIINSLRIFSRGESTDYEKVDLTQGIESTLTIARTQFKNRIELTKEFAELPPVSCNLSQINQVVMNLVMNASQAIDQEGSIVIRTQHLEPYVLIQIIDNGKGMTEEVKNRIFDPFYTTKEVGVGTGMGLAICYEFIRNHNGRIEVESIPDKGTTFNVFLPDHISQLPGKSAD